MQSNRSHTYYRLSLGLGLKWTPLKKIEGSPHSFNNKQDRERAFNSHDVFHVFCWWKWEESRSLLWQGAHPVPLEWRVPWGLALVKLHQTPAVHTLGFLSRGKNQSALLPTLFPVSRSSESSQKLGRERDDFTQRGILDSCSCLASSLWFLGSCPLMLQCVGYRPVGFRGSWFMICRPCESLLF